MQFKNTNSQVFLNFKFFLIFLIFCFRGFESETDTEEFEKVGQSPIEMGFEKRVDSAKEVRLYSGCDIVTETILV